MNELSTSHQKSFFRVPLQFVSSARTFHIDINDTFFQSFATFFEVSPIQDGKGQLTLTLSPIRNDFHLSIDITCELDLLCDRTLRPHIKSMHIQHQVLIQWGDIWSWTETVITVPHATQHLILDHYIYESIMLSLPIKNLHPEEEGEDFQDEEDEDAICVYSTQDSVEKDQTGVDLTKDETKKSKDLKNNTQKPIH